MDGNNNDKAKRIPVFSKKSIDPTSVVAKPKPQAKPIIEQESTKPKGSISSEIQSKE